MVRFSIILFAYSFLLLYSQVIDIDSKSYSLISTMNSLKPAIFIKKISSYECPIKLLYCGKGKERTKSFKIIEIWIWLKESDCWCFSYRKIIVYDKIITSRQHSSYSGNKSVLCFKSLGFNGLKLKIWEVSDWIMNGVTLVGF